MSADGPPLFAGEPEHCSLCGEAGHTHDDHWLFQHEPVIALQKRVRELETELGRLTLPDGREMLLGVTAERVEELRALAKEPGTDEALLVGLRDALRFYDLVRLAWAGCIEENAEDMAARDSHIESLIADNQTLLAELRRYEPSDGVMHQRLAHVEAIRAAARLIINRAEHSLDGPTVDESAWLVLPVVVAARKEPKP